MELFLKIAAVALVSVILTITVEKQEKDISVLLNMMICCICVSMAFVFLEPVLDFMREALSFGGLGEDLLNILLKAVGIALITEIIVLICADAGCSSIGKGLQILGNCAILYSSIPVLEKLLNLLQGMLGEL